MVQITEYGTDAGGVQYRYFCVGAARSEGLLTYQNMALQSK